MIKKIDHIAIAVKNMDDTLNMYKRAYGLEAIKIETYEEVKAIIAFIPVGECEIHLLTPTEPGAGMIGQFLQEKGQGLHHIGLMVEDIENTVERLKKTNITVSDKEFIQEIGNMKIALIEPEGTQNVLIELMETK